MERGDRTGRNLGGLHVDGHACRACFAKERIALAPSGGLLRSPNVRSGRCCALARSVSRSSGGNTRLGHSSSTSSVLRRRSSLKRTVRLTSRVHRATSLAIVGYRSWAAPSYASPTARSSKTPTAFSSAFESGCWLFSSLRESPREAFASTPGMKTALSRGTGSLPLPPGEGGLGRVRGNVSAWQLQRCLHCHRRRFHRGGRG